MNNPYSQYRLAKLQRVNVLRRVWVVVTRFPVFILWQLSRLIPDELGRRFRKRFGFLLAPFQGLIDLFIFCHTHSAAFGVDLLHAVSGQQHERGRFLQTVPRCDDEFAASG